MGTPISNQPGTILVQGTTRQFPVPSCSLTAEDARRLYKILEGKAQRAANHQVGKLKRLPGQKDEELEQVKKNVLSWLKTFITVYDSVGGWTATTDEQVLADSSLPDRVTGIVFDSAALFRNQLKIDPDNSFKVTLDFSRTPILDLTNLSIGPDANKSTVWISGTNDAWVNSLHDDLRSFFTTRKSARAWLHSRYAYDIALWVFGIPASILSVYRIDRFLKLSLSLGIPVATIVCFFLFFLYVLFFRITFNYPKWLFPKIEGPSRRPWAVFHKTLLAIIGTSLVAYVVESCIRMIRNWIRG